MCVYVMLVLKTLMYTDVSDPCYKLEHQSMLLIRKYHRRKAKLGAVQELAVHKDRHVLVP